MKTDECIVQLVFVPDNIRLETDRGIDNGMFLLREAVDDVLGGKMFSMLSCMWCSADKVPVEDGQQVVMMLKRFGINATYIMLS